MSNFWFKKIGIEKPHEIDIKLGYFGADFGIPLYQSVIFFSFNQDSIFGASIFQYVLITEIVCYDVFVVGNKWTFNARSQVRI